MEIQAAVWGYRLRPPLPDLSPLLEALAALRHEGRCGIAVRTPQFHGTLQFLVFSLHRNTEFGSWATLRDCPTCPHFAAGETQASREE